MGSPLRILHVEDSHEDAELVKAILTGATLSCNIVRVEIREAFAAALEREPFDIILADYKLPGFNGMDALRLAKSLRPDTPFLFVSGTIGEEFAVLTLHAGAMDYVLKNQLVRLPSAVRRAINEAESAVVHKRMEASLRESNELLSSVIQSSPSPIIILDKDGMVTLWNPAAERVFGWTQSEVLGHPLPNVLEDKRKEHRDFLEHVLREGGRPNEETVRRKKNGSLVHVNLSTAPLRKADGDIYGILNILTDITERKLMEESLRLHAMRMKSVMDTSLDAIIVMDRRGIIFDWSAQAEPMFGWTKNEAVGRIVAEMIIPVQHREAHVRGLSRFLSTGAGPVLNRQIEVTALHKNGHEFPIELAITSIKINGEWQFTAFIADITRRKQAERRLTAQYAMTQVLAESTTLEEVSGRILQALCECLGWEVGGIWKVDSEANVLRCLETWHVPQPEVAEFVAVSRQRTFSPGIGMPGRVWTRGEPAWIPDVLKDPNFPRAPMAAKAGLHSAIGFPIKIRKNVYGIIEFFSHEIREPDNILMEMLGDTGIKIGQFIERKEDEDALRERDLAKLSAERANQAKSEFLSRMSHELRTPLNAVLGFAQLLEMDALSSEQQEHVQHILKGGRHLLTLINEVLDISRIEAGRMAFSLEPVSVFSVLGEAVDLIRPQAAGRNIQLVLQSPWKETIYVRADRQRVKQVLLNLLSNAVKYNREGGTLTVSGEAAPDNRYRVTVTDTGGGIPSALMSRLFTPFDRLGADATTEGTGLGMVLSRSLTMGMGGTLSVDSAEGQGTSVTVELPLSDPPAARATTMVPDKGHQVAAPASGGAFTVLYIEDNLPNYQLVERLVAKRPGVKLIGAMQGKLGVELAVAHRPDVILLDLNLPDIQGDEVLLRLREHPETAAIPVVMLSADAMKRQVDKLLAAGAQQYLTKPIEVAQFYALLDDLITKKEVR